MQYPVTLALLHCHQRQQANGIADYETIETLSNELAVAEDVTVCSHFNSLILFIECSSEYFKQKEAGLILAARFNLFTGELEVLFCTTGFILHS